MNVNRILGIAAIFLFALSIATYRQSVTRTETFERGQRFLPQLDPDKVARIEITKGETTTTLRRDDDRFLVENVHNYPARNENVNRFLRDILEMSLEREVGDDPEIFGGLGLEPGGENTVEVVFENEAGQQMVDLFLGDSLEGGGSYVRRADGEDTAAYLTQKQLFLTTEPDRFLDQEIVHVERDHLARIETDGYALVRTDGEWSLEGGLPPGKELDSGKVSRLESLLDRLQFEKVYRADAPEVADLTFHEALRAELDDDSGYVLSLASAGETSYLRISGFHHTQKVQITREESKEELAAKADILQRADEMNHFTESRASWVYEMRSSVAETLSFGKEDLLRSTSG